MVGPPKCHKNIAIRKICAKSIFTFKVSGLAAVFFTKLVVIKKFFVSMFLVLKNYAMQKNNLTVIIVLKSLAFASHVSGQILRVWVRSPPFLKFLIFQCGRFE